MLLLFACVLALDTADVSMIGAIAGQLEGALRLSNTELGLLVAVPAVCAAIATVPIGVLTDRVCRTRLLTLTIVIWGAAMAASAATGSFWLLMLTRVALGAANATAGPTVSSLIGDYFPENERGRVYSQILTGELLGAGVGFLVAGELAGLLSWRAAFVSLAVPSLAVAYALWRKLPEPARGGGSRLEPGATEFPTADAPPVDPDEHEMTVAQEEVQERRVPPISDLVLDRDPAGMTLWRATRYVLRVRTNVILIAASALGYFYLAGFETFGLVYFKGWFRLSQTAATGLLALLGGGGLAGVLVAGFAADRLIENGRVNGRILIGGASLVLAALFSLLALLSRTLIVAIPLFVVGSAAFAARDPALDAARLDIMHHRLWGRAEAVRTLLRRLMVASAPIVFGSLADALSSSRTSGNGQHGFGASASAGGLHITFLVLLGTLAAGGLITFRATRTYPQDVATAVASEEATAASSRHGRPGPSGDEQRPTAGGQVVSYRSRSVSRRVSSAE